MSLPAKLAKRIRGECRHCADSALDGSDFCTRHDEHEKTMRRARVLKLRQNRAAAGECMTGCGRKVSKQRRPDGSIVPRECSSCSKEHRKRSAEARARVRNGSPSCVTTDTRSARIAARLIPWSDSPHNEGRTRLRGGKRGAPSMEERDRRDLADMQRILVRYEQALGEAYSQEVAELTRDAQRAARAAAHAGLSLAVRLGMEALVRYGYECPVLAPDEIGDSDDADDT